ncbi:MAG: GTPase HflX [Chlamydiae bacterium]|nr:GTPase HflX [Chlamydiota bacterium]
MSIPSNASEGRLFELKDQRRALLIGVYFSAKDKPDCEEHLFELERLCDTYGLIATEKISVPIKRYEGATYIGSGKVKELALLSDESNIDIVIFDDEISPHQQRNLEKKFQRTVIDRTELILGVFYQRARSKDSKLQVELAKARYQLPRLTRMWSHLSRQRTGGGGGAGGYLKGEGERQIEIDKRLLKRKISLLERELKEVKQHRENQRKKREKTGIPTFAIVGYTNSGKSTLLKALTSAEVLIEDKLFATLDTTTRKYVLPNKQEILLIDTVGFIRKIPHTLVAAFRSTLEEAVEADILIHLIDVSSPTAKEQAIATLEVLKELKASRPIITCLNKIDKIENRLSLMYFKIEYPRTVEISAYTKEGLDELLEKMMQEISLLRKKVKLKIPQSHYAIVSMIIKEARVISLDYEENDIILEVELTPNLEKMVHAFIMS